ncbi:MAG: RiPP maturation radical SAM C-methyltransferase [Terriglobales bacterium]
MPEKRVLLLVMPLLTLPRPHLGVALLKAGMARQGMSCDIRYFSFRFADIIGVPLYIRIAERSPAHLLVGEFIFTPALYGEDARPFADFRASVADYVLPYSEDYLRQLERARNLTPAFIQECADQIDLNQYDIVGFTSSFEQNIASLAMAQEIKRRAPRIVTVFGGANFESEMGVELHRRFPFIDVVCSGEADSVFPELVRRIRAGVPLNTLGGVTCRVNGETVTSSEPQTFVTDLNDLPYPDHSDYYHALQNSTAANMVVTETTMETSRGCWWGQKHHCTFCGLNGMGMTYRSKTPDRAYREIKYLLETYKSPEIFNTDNIVDIRYFSELFPRLAADGFKIQLFYETKANLKKSQLMSFWNVGSTRFCPGIESLNTHVLALMDKGVKGIQNVQLLRWSEEIGFDVLWNVLCGFPGETADDYHQITRWIRAVTHLPSPTVMTRFRLDRFSPMFKWPEKYGIVNIRSYTGYRLCYPFPEDSLLRLAYYQDCDPPTNQETLDAIQTTWSAVAEWQRVHDNSSLKAEVTPSSLIIHERRADYSPADYCFEGLAREIYLATDDVHSDSGVFETVAGRHPEETITIEKVRKILGEFVERELMIQEGNSYLCLAILPLNYESLNMFPIQSSATLSTATAV